MQLRDPRDAPGMPTSPRKMGTVRLQKRDTSELPGDESEEPGPRYVAGAVWSRCMPTPLVNGRVVLADTALLRSIGMRESAGLTRLVSGQLAHLASSCMPVAFNYCGTQFGSFAGQLGDGAVISLGATPSHDAGLVELQLKGVGPTPYTRLGATGRKEAEALVREWCQMEALHRSGVRSARPVALAIGEGGEACLLRMSRSFLRFGTMQLANQRAPNGRGGPSIGDYGLLRTIADHLLREFYPDLMMAYEPEDEEEDENEGLYRELVLEVTRQTAALVASWMCVGWCHGTLNTDNLSLLGETIDHGTGGFMGVTNRGWTPNAVDKGGLYAYGRQPEACRAACVLLAEAMQPLHTEHMATLTPLVESAFDTEYARAHLAGMRRKLLLPETSADDDADARLVEELIDAMEAAGADFRLTFVALAHPGCEQHGAKFCLGVALKLPALDALEAWADRHSSRLSQRHHPKRGTAATVTPTRADVHAAVRRALEQYERLIAPPPPLPSAFLLTQRPPGLLQSASV